MSARICDLLQARASSGRDAFEIADTTLTGIIKTMQPDARFAGIRRSEFELVLVDEQRKLEQVLFRECAIASTSMTQRMLCVCD